MSSSLEDSAKDNSLRNYKYEIDSTVRTFLLEKLSSRFEKNCRVLEVGSYDGYMTKMLLEYFETLTVLEPVESLAQGIQNELKDRVIVENGTILKNRLRGNFDWIFLVHVLEHLESPYQELAELARFLAKNGTMVIAVPNGNALSRQIAREMGLLSDVLEVTRGESLQGHFRTYNSKTLKDEVLESGMDIIESGGVLLKPLANFQLDLALEKEIISISYIEALEKLSETYPDLSSTIYVLARLKNI